MMTATEAMLRYQWGKERADWVMQKQLYGEPIPSFIRREFKEIDSFPYLPLGRPEIGP